MRIIRARRRGDWIGSLVTGQQDATGLMYRRNRYYNPATGQFTQSDPIGIAGGLNTYGFAAGDPASYSDPYGLCIPEKDAKGNRVETECERFAAYVDRLAATTPNKEYFVRALGATVSGFPDGEATMSPNRSPVQFGSSGFRPELVDDDHVPRHFTAYLVLAFQKNKWLANRAAYLREQMPFCFSGCSRSDIRLGDLGAQLGTYLKSDLFPKELVGQWIRDHL